VGSSSRFTRSVLVGGAAALALLVFPPGVTVQDSPALYEDPLAHDWSQDVPAHFTVVDGQVMLERDARLEPAEPNQIVMAGDRLRTTTGRTEILFPDGSTLQVDENTEIDFMSDSLMRLLGGRVRLAIKKDSETLDYRIDTPPGHVEIRKAGDYLIALGSDKRGKPEIELSVYRGIGELVNENGRTTVRAGKLAVTSSDTEPSLPYAFNSADADKFSEWVENLRASHVVSSGSQSAQYLPQEVSYYANTMDTYGSWGYEEPYGAVWYPTVAVGWYPYYQGRWSYTKHYAWTWLGLDHWAWPTYHYGSWGYGAAGYYWVPGYAYAPARVAWGYAPGYVGWCPIGPKGNVPLYDWYGWVGGRYPSKHGGPWTVMPVGSMGHNTWVTANAVRPEQLPMNTRAQFTERRGGPAPSGSAVARRDVGSISSPTAPRSAGGIRASVQRIDGAPASRGAGTVVSPAAALSGFPAQGRASVSMPDALPRAGAGTNGAQRATPRDTVSNVSSGFPASSNGARSAPRAEVNSGFNGGQSRSADGFPSSGAARAVPRGLDAGSNGSVMRAEPGPSSRATTGSVRSNGSNGSAGSNGANGYRAVPPGLQSAPVNRGRSMPTAPSSGNDVQSVAPASRSMPTIAPVGRTMPSMASQPAQRSAPPQMSAPASSAPQQVVPRGRAVSPAASAPSSAPPPAASAPPSRGGGGSSGAASQGSAAAPRRGGGRGGQ